MSAEYDRYIASHRANVKKAYDWIKENLPKIVPEGKNLDWQIEMGHDYSKNDPEEYAAYDAYFYGNNKSYEVVQNFRKAWLHHIHNNPHHWQYWVLINDDPNEGIIALDMPEEYIIEMICDWWSFSWAKNDLHSIFSWYTEHSGYMKLSPSTGAQVELILSLILNKLNGTGGLD